MARDERAMTHTYGVTQVDIAVTTGELRQHLDRRWGIDKVVMHQT